MAPQTVKIAISLPKDKFRIIETLRHKRNISRSALIYETIQHWLNCKKEKELIRSYEEGYKLKPESLTPKGMTSPTHIANLEHIEVEAMEGSGHETW